MSKRIKATFRKSFQVGQGPWQTVELGIEEDIKSEKNAIEEVRKLHRELVILGEEIVAQEIRKSRPAPGTKNRQSKLF